MKRFLTLALCIGISISVLLSGCGSSSSISEETETSSTVVASTTEAYTPPADKPYQLTKDKVTLKFMATQTPAVIDYATNGFVKWFEEQTNVHIEWQTTPNEVSQLKEKINLILASGDLPDVFFGLSEGITTQIETLYGAEQQVFLPLDEYIEKDSVYFKKFIEEYPSVESDIRAINGKIYGLPSFGECYHCTMQGKLWINKPWLDKLGLAIPTTTDELYNVLKAFKTKDPNGNGKDDEIPMTGSKESWNTDPVDTLMNSFITDAGMYQDIRRFVRDGKIMSTISQPEYRDGLKYIKKLQDEGLLYQNSIIQTEAQMKQQVTSDPEIVGFFASGASVIQIDADKQNERYRHFVPISPLVGPAGLKHTFYFPTGPSINEFVITKECENPEIAFKWADLMYNWEINKSRTFGIEGTGWVKAKDGEVGLDGKPALFRSLKQFTSEPQNDGLMQSGIEWETAKIRLGQATDPNVDPYGKDGVEKLLYDATKNLYEPFINKTDKILPILRFTADEQNSISTIEVELKKYIEESRAAFLFGKKSLDTNWDEYLSQLEKIGLSKDLAMYQKAYDRQIKGK